MTLSRAGFANAVGLAIAQAHLGATFNKDGFPIFDNYTFVLAPFVWSRLGTDMQE